jgi:hypothetical protein
MRRKSLRESAFIYDAALGDLSPYPREYTTLESWCFALDSGVPDHARLAPGALVRLTGKDNPTLDEVRRSVRDRVLRTPGIVATSDAGIDTTLIFKVREVQVPKKIEEAMRDIRKLFRLPSGEFFEGGITAWNHAREVACGFAYYWDPPAPQPWKDAKKAWVEFVNHALEHPPTILCKPCNGTGEDCARCGGKGRVPVRLDSPLMVWNAVKQGVFGPPESVDPWVNWRDIRHTFEPNPVPYWLDDYLVRDAEEWALKNNGIVWVAHTSAFTKEESAGIVTGDGEEAIGNMFKRIPYFGAGKAGEAIKTHRGPCAASYRAHGTGKNLPQWHRALWMSFPSSGASVEQLAARHHRRGQEADEVVIEFYCHSREMFDAVMTAKEDAKFMADLNGNSQRILTSSILEADGHVFDPSRYEARKEAATFDTDPMWARNGRKSKDDG